MTETTHLLPVARLRQSETQPRKTYNQARLTELAESIKAQGVMQPIVVRKLAENSPLRFTRENSCQLQFDHEIVFGHRRTLATALAGLEDIPAFVREMTDAEVAMAQIHENLERDDVHPIEEADAFMALMDKHGVTADQLVEQTGKSRSYIYGQIKMARKLGPEVREACFNNVIGSEIALLIARYCPSAKLQPAALQAVKTTEWTGDETVQVAVSARRAKKILRDRFCIRIKEAPFDGEDADLLAEAGACSACPKLAANDPDLAGELDADACTDSECHSRKVQAHVDRQLAAARAAGARVVEGEEALQLMPHSWRKELAGHVSAAATAYYDESEETPASEVTYDELMAVDGKQTGRATYVVDPHKPGSVLKFWPEDAVAGPLTAAMGEDAARGAEVQRTNHPAEAWDQRMKREREAQLAAMAPEDRPFHTHREQIRAACFAAAARRPTRSIGDLLVICRTLLKDSWDLPERLVDAMGWKDELHAALADEAPDGSPKEAEFDNEEEFAHAKLATCDGEALARFATLFSIDEATLSYGDKDAENLKGIAADYGMDALAIAMEPADGAADDDEDADQPHHPAARAAEGDIAGASEMPGDEQPAAQAQEAETAPAESELTAPGDSPARSDAEAPATAEEAPAALEQMDDAGSAGVQEPALPSKSRKSKAKAAAPSALEQMDDAGSAGVQASPGEKKPRRRPTKAEEPQPGERDPRVPDMFEGVAA